MNALETGCRIVALGDRTLLEIGHVMPTDALVALPPPAPATKVREHGDGSRIKDDIGISVRSWNSTPPGPKIL